MDEVMNITISVPIGTTNHGSPNLLCTPPRWYDYVVFYFGNYLAHAATVVLYPGEDITRTVVIILSALFLPTSGVIRAVRCLLRHAGTTTKNPLRRAAQAGALCMVVRTLG